MANSRTSEVNDQLSRDVCESKCISEIKPTTPFLGNLKLPKVIWHRIFTQELKKDLRSQAMITATYKGTNQLFRQSMFDTRHTKLLQHVLYGEKDQVETMLKTAFEESKAAVIKAAMANNNDTINPWTTVLYLLLCTVGTEIDLADRRIEGSPYRMAIGAKDITVPDVVGGIAELIAFYLKQIPEGESLIYSQRRDQFPEMKKEQNESEEISERTEYIRNLFEPVFNAIKHEAFQGKSTYQYYYLHTAQKPTKETIHNLLPFENQAAYVYHNDHLYYIDRNKRECIEFTIFDHYARGMKELKSELGPSNPLSAKDLHKLQYCISHFLINENTEKILKEFGEKLKPKEVIKTGFHFDENLYVITNELLRKTQERNNDVGDLCGWNPFGLKGRLFWAQVLGQIEQNFPACCAQEFCTGFSIDEDKKIKLIRKLYLSEGTHFFSISSGIGTRGAVHDQVGSYLESFAIPCGRYNFPDFHNKKITLLKQMIHESQQSASIKQLTHDTDDQNEQAKDTRRRCVVM